MTNLTCTCRRERPSAFVSRVIERDVLCPVHGDPRDTSIDQTRIAMMMHDDERSVSASVFYAAVSCAITDLDMIADELELDESPLDSDDDIAVKLRETIAILKDLKS